MVANLQNYDRPLTLEDLDATPDDGRRYEILQGELIVSPSPSDTHQVIHSRLHFALAAANRRARFGHVRGGLRDVRLTPSDIVIPDLFAYRKSQETLASERLFDGAPAFVIEILSPGSRQYDEVRKAFLYMNAGVEEYWIVDPIAKRILVHRNAHAGANPEIVIDGAFTAQVLPEFTIDLAELFAPQGEYE